jgi:hypothetical protein
MSRPTPETLAGTLRDYALDLAGLQLLRVRPLAAYLPRELVEPIHDALRLASCKLADLATAVDVGAVSLSDELEAFEDGCPRPTPQPISRPDAMGEVPKRVGRRRAKADPATVLQPLDSGQGLEGGRRDLAPAADDAAPASGDGGAPLAAAELREAAAEEAEAEAAEELPGPFDEGPELPLSDEPEAEPRNDFAASREASGYGWGEALPAEPEAKRRGRPPKAKPPELPPIRFQVHYRGSLIGDVFAVDVAEAIDQAAEGMPKADRSQFKAYPMGSERRPA